MAEVGIFLRRSFEYFKFQLMMDRITKAELWRLYLRINWLPVNARNDNIKWDFDRNYSRSVSMPVTRWLHRCGGALVGLGIIHRHLLCYSWSTIWSSWKAGLYRLHIPLIHRTRIVGNTFSWNSRIWYWVISKKLSEDFIYDPVDISWPNLERRVHSVYTAAVL